MGNCHVECILYRGMAGRDRERQRDQTITKGGESEITEREKVPNMKTGTKILPGKGKQKITHKLYFYSKKPVTCVTKQRGTLLQSTSQNQRMW